jgi:hypothetical protein
MMIYDDIELMQVDVRRISESLSKENEPTRQELPTQGMMLNICLGLDRSSVDSWVGNSSVPQERIDVAGLITW